MIKAKVLEYGAEGKAVEEAQKLLQKAGSTIKVNGKYTVGMISAVKAFQKKHKLPVTGKIDTKTQNKLNEYKKPMKKPTAAKTTKK